MQKHPVTRSRLRLAWIVYVLGGAFCGAMFFGEWGAVAGATFMATAGEVYRRERLRRAAQLRKLRERQELRKRSIAPA